MKGLTLAPIASGVGLSAWSPIRENPPLPYLSTDFANLSPDFVDLPIAPIARFCVPIGRFCERCGGRDQSLAIMRTCRLDLRISDPELRSLGRVRMHLDFRAQETTLVATYACHVRTCTVAYTSRVILFFYPQNRLLSF